MTNKRMLQKSLNLWFGMRVSVCRKAKRLTQAKVAHAAGVTRVQLSNIESGRSATTLATAYLIAEALGAEIKTLLPTRKELEQP